MEKAFSLGIQITRPKLNILISNFKLSIIYKRWIVNLIKKRSKNYERFDGII